MCACVSTLNAIHVSSIYSSFLEISVVSRLKFSKSVFPIWCLFGQKEICLTYWETQQQFAVVHLLSVPLQPLSFSQSCCTPICKLTTVLEANQSLPHASSTPEQSTMDHQALRQSFSGAAGLKQCAVHKGNAISNANTRSLQTYLHQCWETQAPDKLSSRQGSIWRENMKYLQQLLLPTVSECPSYDGWVMKEEH